MRTDTELIEAFLMLELSPAEKQTLSRRRDSDPRFRRNLAAQAKVHTAALLYGRFLRRARILAAGEEAFADPQFRHQVNAIFQ